MTGEGNATGSTSPPDGPSGGDPDDAAARRVATLISGLLRWGVRASLALFVVVVVDCVSVVLPGAS